MRNRKKKPLRDMSIDELLAEAEYIKSEIEAKHNVAINQFRLLNIRDHIRRKRYGYKGPRREW